ncbi:hypothetical protein BJ138DRAFT_1154807 [Hygrophoropsis aurantiaca]|uniref:Uncharacterized protein n=1 Tax=Hygrophoropsis aurantiaca TaxID=72124 RepID=A0ACB8A8X6_9AGAM|nr:hypothetical protein BJ138DRAFT_1154807 [Hygrophoropsis aurantiaca]
MHHALTIPEIIYEIFSYLPNLRGPYLRVRKGRGYHTNISHTTLAALAATCRTFREPALDMRWRRLPSVYSLIPLFPYDIWDKYDPDEYNPDDVDLNFSRLPSTEEWIRFESYTSRIREIQVSKGGFEGMANVMATLLMKYNAHSSRHLFPNLRTVTWCSQEKSELQFAHLFLPPSLRCLTVEFDCFDPDPRAPGLVLLPEHQCPTLTQFRIRGPIFSQSLIAAVSRALESRPCQQLESLDCDQIDESALRYIAKLPTLKDLSIYLPYWLSTYGPDEGFINLQTLSLTASDLSAVVGFLPPTRLPLKSLRICIMPDNSYNLPSAPLQQLFSRLSAGLRHTHLTQFHLLGPPHNDLRETLDFAALRPLSLFSELTSVRLHGFCGFDLDDDALAELAGAWPHLEELTLEGCRRTPEITLKGVRSLIRACPLLHTLELAIDATRLCFISSATPGEDIHNDSIEALDLGKSTIDNPADVARILGDLFWALKKVYCSHFQGNIRNPYAQLWDEVNAHLLGARAGKQKIAP